MTWLISKIVGNPMVLLALLAAAFVVGVSSGASTAWWIQSLRLTAAEQDHTRYVQSLKQQEQEFRDEADQKRESASLTINQLKGQLDAEIKSGAVYRRCVAAGRCGVRHQPVACSPSIRLPSIGGNDDPIANPVPATGEHAAEVIDPVVNDCAVTTLRLNRLQAEVEGQEGYRKKERQQ